jgi:creatinine amidohydrolase
MEIMNPFILAESSWKTIKDANIELAILPWGATEAHNLHLPYSTDNIETDRITREAARKAFERGAEIIVLPIIPFGVNTGQLDIPVNININPSTQFAILKDITDVLNRHGIHKFLIVNGHGGNDFKQMIRELGFNFPEMFIATCNWYQAVDQSRFFEEAGGHADEMETSLMLFLEPALVLPVRNAGKGDAKKFRINALNENWAWSERKWSKVTKDTGVGNPAKATREKGEKYFNAVTDSLCELISDLAGTDISDMYV